jgi:dolichol-phosphate mannosyltransferase
MSDLVTPRSANRLSSDASSAARQQPQKDHGDSLSDGTTWIVLPAYNEQDGIEPLIHKIHHACRGLNYAIVVVDDASTDNTAGIVSRLSFDGPISLEQHPQNQGLAGALRTGFEYVLARGSDGDIVVTMDADDTHSPATIPKMLTMIHEGYDVVIASRYQPGSRTVGVPWHRQVLTWGARWIFKIVTPIYGVRDYTCGFRAYRFDRLRQARDHYGARFVSEPGFSCMPDVLLKMRPLNFVMGEVPMLLRYDQKQGVSKMNVGRTTRQTLKLLAKRRLGR